MLANHAEIVVKGNRVSICPVHEDGRVLINGVPIGVETVLNPNDRLVFGATQLWLFRHPALESDAGVSASPMINYDYFLNEMAAKSGLTLQANASDSQGFPFLICRIMRNELIISLLESLQEELVTLLPSVEEANGISAELDKRVKFEIVLIAPQVLGNAEDKTAHSQVIKRAHTRVYYTFNYGNFINDLCNCNNHKVLLLLLCVLYRCM